MLSTFHAREHYHRLKVGYTAEGVVTALDATIEVDCGAYSIYPWTAAMDVEMGLVMLPGPYKIRNFRCEAQSVATNKCPFGAYRGVARTAVCFSIERVMDQFVGGTSSARTSSRTCRSPGWSTTPGA
jgi:carbon-monoxide dehydrogenase large subunit